MLFICATTPRFEIQRSALFNTKRDFPMSMNHNHQHKKISFSINTIYARYCISIITFSYLPIKRIRISLRDLTVIFSMILAVSASSYSWICRSLADSSISGWLAFSCWAAVSSMAFFRRLILLFSFSACHPETGYPHQSLRTFPAGGQIPVGSAPVAPAN